MTATAFRSQEEVAAWIQFAAAALSKLCSPGETPSYDGQLASWAASEADAMLVEFRCRRRRPSPKTPARPR